MTALRWLARDRRGGVGMIVAAAMPLMIGMAAFAVDIGSVQLDARRLQGIADAAALAAASEPTQAQVRAEASVADAGWTRTTTVQVAGGRYAENPSVAADQRFTAGGSDPNAVRVTVESSSPTFLAAIFGQHAVTITRNATARRQRLAAFSIGSRLASLDGGLLNAYLGALTGSSLSLSIMDYNALAGADVDLFEFLPALRTSAGLGAVTFDQVLQQQVTTPQALNALAAVLTANGRSQAAAAIRALAASAGSGSLTLAAILNAGPMASQSTGGIGVARVDTLAFATALLQLAAQTRQVTLDLAAGIPGLASTRVTLAIGERTVQSPWIAISEQGTPIVRTAQTRLYANTRIAPTLLPGLSGLAAIDLPLFVELAAAEGRLKAIDCASEANRSVTLEARTDVASAAIGTVDTTRLDDFSTPIFPATAKLIDTLLVDVTGSSRISLGAAEPWQELRFPQSAIDAGTRKTVASSTPVRGVATSLIGQAQLGVSVLGLPIAVDPLLRAVGASLGLVAPALDTLLMTATGTLGVGLGEADLRVTGMRCGQAVLVA